MPATMAAGTGSELSGDAVITSPRGQELARNTIQVTTEWTMLARHQPRPFRSAGAPAAQVCRAIVSPRASRTLSPGGHATPLTFIAPGRDSAPGPPQAGYVPSPPNARHQRRSALCADS